MQAWHIAEVFPLPTGKDTQHHSGHLALEDDYGRLQKRLSRMFGVESTDAFHLATRSKTLNQG